MIRSSARAGPNSQIVLLGAGMDTRAFRLPLPASCTVFEIDYAEAFTRVPAASPARVVRRLADAGVEAVLPGVDVISADCEPLIFGAHMQPDHQLRHPVRRPRQKRQ